MNYAADKITRRAITFMVALAFVLIGIAVWRDVLAGAAQ